jgi:malate permease and related proteins
MTDTLLRAYLPLLIWPSVGLVLIRVLPDQAPRLLGRGLYWVGIPLEVFALTRRTSLSDRVGLAPFFAVFALVTGLALAWATLAWLTWRSQRSVANFTAEPVPVPALQQLTPAEFWADTSRRGSFILSSMIANTGFVGLAIAPIFISERYISWIVFYSVAHNVLGTYGIGVFLASYFGRSQDVNLGWTQVRDVLTVPSLWAYAIGMVTRPLLVPNWVDDGLQASVWIVIPIALTLMGMRLSQLNGWSSLKWAIAPTVLKVMIVPAVVGLAATLAGVSSEPRLAVVLMAGMPSAFAGLILAEEYELDRELIASSIVLTTGLLLLTIPVWLLVFGT